MDDYILKVLSRQSLPEETAGKVLREKERYLSRALREGTEDRKILSQEQDRGQAEKKQAVLWSMLKSMEPLSMATPIASQAGGNGGGSVWHVPESLSRFSGTVFGQKTRQLTPEGLSMFYQRDARRFS